MFARLGQFVSRHWLAVVFAWIVVVALSRAFLPRWDDVTYDGDLAYMPAHVSSVRGERLLEQAFPRERSKSEIVIIFARPNEELSVADLQMVDRVASRMHNLLGCAALQRADRFQAQADKPPGQGPTELADDFRQQAQQQRRKALAAWEECVRLDEHFGLALNNRAYYYERSGEPEPAERDRQLAQDFAPGLIAVGQSLLPADMTDLPIIDVWTRHTDVVGPGLRSKDRQAEVVVLRLAQEFMATDNIRVLGQIESVLQDVREQSEASGQYPPGLIMGITGSAAVGGDMLRSAAASIQNTELYTILLVVTILILVYRSPLLVAVPLITIVVSVIVSTGLVAALTQMHRLPGFEWWNFKIFTTTKIFVVVILFGAGTDYCLFLISRYREELSAGRDSASATSGALHGVGDALAASALTTIIGLATMFFAEFGKFRNSGPAIGLCLTVTLLACVTLAPALLRALGPAIFWPFGPNGGRLALPDGTPQGRAAGLWERLSHLIVTRPGRVLVLSMAVMAPLAVLGTQVQVTYDFLSELEPTRPSRQGTHLMRQHFPIGETGPLTVLARTRGGDLDSDEGKIALKELTQDLYLDGVQAVRSLAEPRGERPTGFSLKKAALQTHELTRLLYLSKLPELGGDVARFELILEHDPFSLDATRIVNRLDARLQAESQDAESYWSGSEFIFAGTTAAIRDLRDVTRRDNLLIQILVVLAVLLVLLLILRRPIVCLYLILSVLFSYYVTIGATQWFFRLAYGETFQGLDWKVPLFLFVILVAIGQDYNIYLATRVFEEQSRYGLIGGLQRAIVRTGGIITSCGVIMAGTFVSMTTGSLRGIVELGFALSLGVLLDTFVVRTVLVPAFLAILFRLQATAPPPADPWIEAPHLLGRKAARARTP